MSRRELNTGLDARIKSQDISSSSHYKVTRKHIKLVTIIGFIVCAIKVVLIELREVWVVEYIAPGVRS